jgi:hypothetical protein
MSFVSNDGAGAGPLFLPGAIAARESGIEDSREFAHYIE